MIEKILTHAPLYGFHSPNSETNSHADIITRTAPRTLIRHMATGTRMGFPYCVGNVKNGRWHAWATPFAIVAHLLAETCAGFIIDIGPVSVTDLGSGSQGTGLAIAERSPRSCHRITPVDAP